MNKKPAVVAKTAAKKRKVSISKSEAELAKHFGIPIESVAKAKLPKRGRPAGTKNKPKVKDPFQQDFEAWVNRVEANKRAVDWQNLCNRLQEALAKEIKENDDLRTEINRKRSFFERLVCLTTGSV